MYDIDDTLTLQASILFESSLKDIILTGFGGEQFYVEASDGVFSKAKEKVLLALKKIQEKVRKVIASDVNKKYDAEYKKLISKNPTLQNIEIAYDPTADAEIEIGEQALNALKNVKSMEEANKIQRNYEKMVSEIKKDKKKAAKIASLKVSTKIVGAVVGTAALATTVVLPKAIYNTNRLREYDKKINMYMEYGDKINDNPRVKYRDNPYEYGSPKYREFEKVTGERMFFHTYSSHGAYKISGMYHDAKNKFKNNTGILEGIYTNILYKTATAVSKAVDNTIKAKKQVISEGNSTTGPLNTLK